jgi:hypothetical protein
MAQPIFWMMVHLVHLVQRFHKHIWSKENLMSHSAEMGILQVSDSYHLHPPASSLLAGQYQVKLSGKPPGFGEGRPGLILSLSFIQS